MGGRMTAPSAFIAALALGGIVGWLAAWIILKQRLDHYKERIEYFKERSDSVPSPKPDTSRAKKRLQQLYLQAGTLVGRKIEKENPDAAVQTLESECDGWLKQSIEWIGANMGEAATGRFLDKSNHYAASYSGAVNGEHNRLISALTNFRKNLQVLIVEFDAGNSKD
jgi:hypothetical protein